MIECSETADALIFAVRVVPKSSKSEIVGEMDGALKVKLNAAPVEGAANRELIELLATTFAVPKRCVAVVAGQTSKTKRIKITGGSVEILRRL